MDTLEACLTPAVLQQQAGVLSQASLLILDANLPPATLQVTATCTRHDCAQQLHDSLSHCLSHCSSLLSCRHIFLPHQLPKRVCSPKLAAA